MSNETKTEIAIFGHEDIEEYFEDERGAIFERLEQFRYGIRKIDVDEIKDSLSKFLDAMQDVVNYLPSQLGAFKLDTVTLTVEISANGKVSLLGTGAELAGKGGLTFP